MMKSSSSMQEDGFIAWTQLRLSKPFLMALGDLKFATPTPIQREAIPVALQGKDVLATAETGSGKTAAFTLPIVERLWHAPSVHCRKVTSSGTVGGRAATRVLILLPTRELAIQCNDMIKDLVKYTPITHSLVYGGMSSHAQASALRYQPDMVVATPGRVLDLLMNSQSVHMEQLEIVVLDEADRLLEMGFKEECLQVLKHCSRTRQTLLFSATLSEEISDFADLALSTPVRVTTNTASKVTKSLTQEFVQIPGEAAREASLIHLCKSIHKSSAIIFFQTKKTAHRMSIIFNKLGIVHAELHGNLSQAQRQTGLETFQNGQVGFLIATELASRGLDIANVEAVINFHPPQDIVRYVHRVGRTARMGASGKAVTLFTQEERLQVKRIARAVTQQKSGRNVLKETFHARRIQKQTIEKWEKKVEELEEEISKTLKQELADKEMKLAEMYVRKTENMSLFQDEITRRPEKKWFVTNKEKVILRKSSKEAATKATKTLQAPKVPSMMSKSAKNRGQKKPRPKLTRTEQERRRNNVSIKLSARRAKRQIARQQIAGLND